MRVFWDTSRNARHQGKTTLFNFILTLFILAGIVFVSTLFLVLYDWVAPTSTPVWDLRIHSWWINSRYGQALGMRYIYVPEHESSFPADVETYPITISDRPHWKEPDYGARYRSLLGEVRRGYHVPRRSHIQEHGTRVTCWPRGENWGYDGGFYTRHVSAVELDWLGLPRFQDTVRSRDQVVEDAFCEKFKSLLPFYYMNSTWYSDIVRFDERQFRGCEPGFSRVLQNGLVTSVEMRDCYKASPLAFLQHNNEGASLTYLERPLWITDDWNDLELEPGISKWEPAGRIGNALTMEERITAIRDSGGKTLTGEKLTNFLGCWYAESRTDCGRFGGFAGYHDWHLDYKQRWP